MSSPKEHRSPSPSSRPPPEEEIAKQEIAEEEIMEIKEEFRDFGLELDAKPEFNNGELFLHWIMCMRRRPKGRAAALDLLIELQLEVLLLVPSWPGFYPDKCALELNRVIHEDIQYTLNGRSRDKESDYMNYTNACRRLRQGLQFAGHCYYFRGSNEVENGCPYNCLMPTLDTLQRHAYFEIRSIVRSTLEGRLPAELVHMIFERTMEAEGIESDPRIILHSLKIDDVSYYMHPYKSCRFPCSHDQKPDHQGTLGGPLCQYAHGTEYYETLPKFPHGVASYEELELKEEEASVQVRTARLEARAEKLGIKASDEVPEAWEVEEYSEDYGSDSHYNDDEY